MKPKLRMPILPLIAKYSRTDLNNAKYDDFRKLCKLFYTVSKR